MDKIILTIDTKLLANPELKALFDKLGIAHHIKADTSQASAAVRSLSESISSAFMKFGLITNGLSSAANIIQKITGAFISPASEIEQLRLRLTSLYGSTEAASAAFNKFRDIATRTPATLQQVVEAGASLKAFGLDAENTLESVSDLAAYMGLDVVEASQAVGRAFAGGAGAADILRERGVLELIKSFKGIDDLSKLTLPEFRSVLLETLSDPAAGIAGSADRIAASYAGALSNLDDSFTTLRANIGAQLTPVLSGAASALSGLIQSLTGTGSQLQIATRNAEEQKLQFDTLVITYEDLHKKVNRSDTDNQLYQETINSLLRLYPNYFAGIDLEKGKWGDISTAIQNAGIQLQNYLNLQIQEAAAKDFQDDILKTRLKIIENTRKRNQLTAEMNAEGADKGTYYRSNFAGDPISYGHDLQIYQNNIDVLTKKEKKLTAELNEQANLTKQLYAVKPIAPIHTPPASETPASGMPASGMPVSDRQGLPASGGHSGSDILSPDQIQSAQAELRRLFASETETIQIEYERRSALITTAYANDDTTAKAYITNLDNWKTAKLKEITAKELAATEAANEALNAAEAKRLKDAADAELNAKNDLLAAYSAEIERLANLKTIGGLTYDNLTASLKNYTDQIKLAFGAESPEYEAALSAMRSAQLRISETLADNWKKDNADFLAAWNATSESLVSGFDSAWNSITSKNLSATETLKQSWDSMRSSFLNSIGNMASQYIQSRLTELAIHLTVEKSKQAAILQTLGIQKSALVSSVATALKSAFAGLFEAISNVWKWWTKLVPPPYSVAAALATGAGMVVAFNGIKKSLGFASGGLISGPGSHTSDSIPILASNGEFVVNAASVAKPGVLPLLQQINSLYAPSLPFSSPANFASGGLVAPYSLAHASASDISALSSDLSALLSETRSLVQETRSLRSDVYKAQPTIINNAPNPIDIHKLSETGRKLYKSY